jgi:UDP-N-acetyl-2-amino-2-deoxyglucuronate dehydrogenase
MPSTREARVPLNFALVGAAGFVAQRHLDAIRDTGNRLAVAFDPHDAVGILDRDSFDVRFFTEYERFDRHLDKLRKGDDQSRVHYLSICSPNYLHDAHIRLALRVGANVICEKPTVVNPWNLDAIEELEAETGLTVNTVLQLRLHEKFVTLRERLAAEPRATRHEVCLTYITPRGRWYDVSWKGAAERSGGLVTNIGIHLFDLLLWLFGDMIGCEVHHVDPDRVAGFLELERARVRWFLSKSPTDLQLCAAAEAGKTLRTLELDGERVEFSDGFTDLHTQVYREALAGRGFRIPAARPAIVAVRRIRDTAVTNGGPLRHPLLVER